MIDLKTLKTRVDLRTVVQETHLLTKSSKTCCLWHDDTNPSLHIYPDGYFCFACGASGDHLDWLAATRALSFQEAVDVLVRHTGTSTYFTPAQLTTPVTSHALVTLHEPVLKKPTFEWRLPLRQHQLETHQRRAAKLTEVPEALTGRGFTLADCKRLGIINENGNAVFPVIGPSGLALTLKCRYAAPSPHRYEYVTPGHGTPAWCSPDIRQSKAVFVIEGELNGMMCWLALRCRDNQIGVMGTAGTHGLLYLDVLENKTVYIYADGDEAGNEARQRWAKQALGAGAKEVYVLEPWPLDACDTAGALGKAALRKRLTWSRKQRFVPTEAFGAVNAPGAIPSAPKPIPSLSAKPDLVQWCSHSKGALLSSVPKLLQSSPPTLTQESHHDAA